MDLDEINPRLREVGAYLGYLGQHRGKPSGSLVPGQWTCTLVAGPRVRQFRYALGYGSTPSAAVEAAIRKWLTPTPSEPRRQATRQPGPALISGAELLSKLGLE